MDHQYQTGAELKQVLQGKGVHFPSKSKKADLVARLLEVDGQSRRKIEVSDDGNSAKSRRSTR